MKNEDAALMKKLNESGAAHGRLCFINERKRVTSFCFIPSFLMGCIVHGYSRFAKIAIFKAGTYSSPPLNSIRRVFSCVYKKILQAGLNSDNIKLIDIARPEILTAMT